MQVLKIIKMSIPGRSILLSCRSMSIIIFIIVLDCSRSFQLSPTFCKLRCRGHFNGLRLGATMVDNSLLSDQSFAELYGCNSSHDDGETGCIIPNWLTQRCEACGWQNPTIVQKKAMDAILFDKSDVVLQAQTGSGKTLAYLLPVLSNINASRAAVQAVVIVPTRELGLQVARVAKRLAAGSNSNNEAKGKIMVMSVLQGSSNKRQRAWAWAEPPHVVIGTPDELGKMVSKGGIRYNSVEFVVVDEVDACLGNKQTSNELHSLLSRYLSPTYNEAEKGSDISLTNQPALEEEDYVSSYNKNRQTIFASATIPSHNHFMKQCVQQQWTVNEPRHVQVMPGELIPAGIDHKYIVCANIQSKLKGLRRLLKREISKGKMRRALIFFEPYRPLEDIAEELVKDFNGILWNENCEESDASGKNVIVSVLRYESSLSERASAMNIFQDDSNTGSARLLLATDLAARGLDVPDISHVINFDLPNDGDTYVHRGGRTGRLGRKGSVISLITTDQEFVLERLANKLFINVNCLARQKKKL